MLKNLKLDFNRKRHNFIELQAGDKGAIGKDWLKMGSSTGKKSCYQKQKNVVVEIK